MRGADGRQPFSSLTVRASAPAASRCSRKSFAGTALGMIHRYLYRFSELPDADPARHFIALALLQADQDGASEVTVGVWCNPDISAAWSVQGTIYSLGMPPALRALQVWEVLAMMAGLDRSGPFPQESELGLEFGNTLIRWLVSLADPVSRITLKRKP